MTTDALRYLGRDARDPITADALDTVPAPPGLRTVTVDTAELTAICPVTGQPDLYHATVTYEPNGLIAESKALKLYLVGFRDHGIMCEHLADRIAADLAPVLRAPVTVTLRQQVRGGLVITATAERTPDA